MSEHTLECGHSYNLNELVLRAISCENEFCPVCKKPWSNAEGFYLSYINTETTTFQEYTERVQATKAEQSERKLCNRCIGVTLAGKPCRNLAKKGSECCARHTK